MSSDMRAHLSVRDRTPSNLSLPPALLAAEVRAVLRLAPSHYVDLEAATKLWPGLTQIHASIDKAGYLLDFGDEGEILLRDSDPVTRQRFTWAHELGHWMLAGACSTGSPRSSDVHALDIERWCDQFAANLLIAPGHFGGYVTRSHDELLEAGLAAARQFRVSLSAATAAAAEACNVSMFVVSSRHRARPTWFGPRVDAQVARRVTQLAPPADHHTYRNVVSDRTIVYRRVEPRGLFGSVE